MGETIKGAYRQPGDDIMPYRVPLSEEFSVHVRKSIEEEGFRDFVLASEVIAFSSRTIAATERMDTLAEELQTTLAERPEVIRRICPEIEIIRGIFPLIREGRNTEGAVVQLPAVGVIARDDGNPAYLNGAFQLRMARTNDRLPPHSALRLPVEPVEIIGPNPAIETSF